MAVAAPTMVADPAAATPGNCQNGDALGPPPPVWYPQTVPPTVSPIVFLDVPWTPQSVISVSVGLRMVGGDAVHKIQWFVGATSGLSRAEESTTQTRWFASQADWQEIEIVTDTTGGFMWAHLGIQNLDPTTAYMEFTCAYSVIESHYPSRVVTPYIDYSSQASLPPYSGITPVVWLTNLAANTMYHFNVRVALSTGSDPEQVAAWLWRCYRSETDPPSPSALSHGSRHVEYWMDTALDVLVLTYTAGAYCGLWINNWDPSPQTYVYTIEGISAGPIARQTAWVGEASVCVDLAPGEVRDIVLTTLTPPGRYLGWARVILDGVSQTGDSEQKSNWYVALGKQANDGGQREGYNVRYWTDYLPPYNPFTEGTVLGLTVYYDMDFWIHIKNADTTPQRYCYGGYVYKYGN